MPADQLLQRLLQKTRIPCTEVLSKKMDSISEALRSYEHQSKGTRGRYVHDAAGWTTASGDNHSVPKDAIKLETGFALENMDIHRNEQSLERPDAAEEQKVSDQV